MKKPNLQTKGRCCVTGKEVPLGQLRSWASVRPGVSALIAAETADWGDGKFISHEALVRFRRLYVESLLEEESGELSALEREVVASLENGHILSREPETDEAANFGERAADAVAQFGGSWTFILGFVAVLGCWIIVNTLGFLLHPFDPYPFILLNLVLSCVAAFQAPVIMMSQRRQETKDRQRSQNDYQVNLKAELEIRLLHEKIDHQLAHQWQKLVEMQQIQIDLLEEQNGKR